jgi:hypothetical protein
MVRKTAAERAEQARWAALEAELRTTLDAGTSPGGVQEVLKRHGLVRLDNLAGITDLVRLWNETLEPGAKPKTKQDVEAKMNRRGAPPYVRLAMGRAWDAADALAWLQTTLPSGRPPGPRPSSHDAGQLSGVTR